MENEFNYRQNLTHEQIAENINFIKIIFYHCSVRASSRQLFS